MKPEPYESDHTAVKFGIDTRSPVAPGDQIAQQVRMAVAAGRAGEGERLPSVRTAAADALVNPNTIARAYRILEAAGVIQTRPGDGVFIASGARQICQIWRDQTINDALHHAIDEALAAGLPENVIRGWVEACLNNAIQAENP